MFGAAGATSPRRFVSYQPYSTAASASFSKNFLMIIFREKLFDFAIDLLPFSPKREPDKRKDHCHHNQQRRTRQKLQQIAPLFRIRLVAPGEPLEGCSAQSAGLLVQLVIFIHWLPFLPSTGHSVGIGLVSYTFRKLRATAPKPVVWDDRLFR